MAKVGLARPVLCVTWRQFRLLSANPAVINVGLAASTNATSAHVVAIGQPPTASGKRPLFALNPDQAERCEMLREVVRHAGDIYQDAAEWLRRVNRSTMFAGKPPITLMVAEGRGGSRPCCAT
jgi:uncharacterized protein (DUF2384 family)